MMRLTNLLKILHVHIWNESAWNKYQIATEQSCRCGARRYHLIDDYEENGPWEPPTWRNGEHPVAAKMRAAGIVRNY